MRSLLNPESPAMRFLTKIGYTIILNLLWFLCSLPLFTIGASTTALYAVMQKLVRNEESGIASAFFTAFKQNFKQATKIWLVLLAALIFLGFDGYILLHLRNLNAFWTILTAVWFVLAAACVIVLLYVFPLTARFNNTTFAMIRNSLMTGMHFLFCTVLIAHYLRLYTRYVSGRRSVRTLFRMDHERGPSAARGYIECAKSGSFRDSSL